MKVFISWSGDRSRAIADVLRRWLPSVLQAVRPYFSPDDVAKGSRWSAEIAKELEASRVGLLVITPENQEAPWLLFEAGALAKNLDRSKVCPILFGGMEPTDVKGPLVQFQAAQFSKDEIKRVVKMMNGELGDAALASDVLDGVLEMWWQRLETEVNGLLDTDAGEDSEARRSDRELLEEVLGLTRRLVTTDREHRSVHPAAFEDLLMCVLDLAALLRTRSADEESATAIRRLMGPLNYILREDLRGRAPRRILRRLEDLLESDLRAKAASVDSSDVPET